MMASGFVARTPPFRIPERQNGERFTGKQWHAPMQRVAESGNRSGSATDTKESSSAFLLDAFLSTRNPKEQGVA